MATTVEERIKEMDASRRTVEPVWDKAMAKFQKEMAAPPFPKLGNVKSLAHVFDVVQSKFEGTHTHRDDAGTIIEDGWTAFMNMGKTTASLGTQLDAIFKDALASVRSGQSKTLEDKINDWDELLKEHRDINKETKNLFDQVLKAGDDRLKLISDTSAKVQALMKADNARLASYNAELNGLEDQIRSMVIKYQKAAQDMKRADIAEAARGFLKVFGN